jgi:methionyl-tRNA formyltransferase
MGDIKSAQKLNKENTRIDWTKSAEAVSNLIRGLSPYPCAHSVLAGPKGETPIKIFSASYSKAPHQHKPGTIISDNKTFIKVACGEGFCNLLEVQLSGKKRMLVRDLLLGFREAEKHSMI